MKKAAHAPTSQHAPKHCPHTEKPALADRLEVQKSGRFREKQTEPARTLMRDSRREGGVHGAFELTLSKGSRLLLHSVNFRCAQY